MTQRLDDFGPYRIVRPIATGGMAEIYLARQRGLEGLERTVVIKRILEQYADDEEFVTMFLDEARLLAALSHPNIAQVFDLGKVENTFYLTMEHVRGPTLGRLLAASRDAGQRLPRREALGIALGIAEALHYAHERRDEVGRPLDIVHRDLNPANVIVSYDGAVKLIDFGIAKAATKVYETRTGVIKGTYGYIAPEQLVGTTPVDLRADVFALGILLYEMCVGVHPFDASNEPNLIDRILEARYQKPRAVQPDIPRDLDRLIASCLSPHPAGRPNDMGELIDALAKHLGEQGMVPTKTSLAQVARRLVPDDEGARPLKPLTSPARKRPFGREPTSTQQLGKGTTAVVPYPEKTAVAKLPGGREWRNAAMQVPDEEPLTVMSDAHAADVEMPGDEDMPTLARNLDPLPMRVADHLDDEPPTRLMSLAGVSRPRRDPTDVVAPQPRKGRPAWLSALMLVLAGLGLVTVSGLAFYTVRSMNDGTETAQLSAASDAPSDAPATTEEGSPVELRVVSEPEGAIVHVDGRATEGTTPLTVTLPAETRQVWLRLSMDGRIDQEREVSATVGEARFVLPALSLDEGAAEDDDAPEGQDDEGADAPGDDAPGDDAPGDDAAEDDDVPEGDVTEG